MSDALSRRTIRDFGDQWTRYTDSDGYYGSNALLADIFGPLLPLKSLQGRKVTEIGSGSGRIVQMLLSAGADHVTAVEPSRAMEVLRRNSRKDTDRITYYQCRGDELPEGPAQDFVVSIGVLHHIPDPGPVLAAAYRALRPGGQILIWLYGREGNWAYLSFALPIRAVTTRLPHAVLMPLCHFLNTVLAFYIRLARWLPLPLRGYMREVIGNFSRQKRYLVIYDQLKPAYAKYYRRQEALSLLEEAGFVNLRIHHRHGYSWTVLGHRPLMSEEASG